MAKLFKSSIPNIFMILSSGIKAEFINGIYYTTNEASIAELQKEVALGHPHISIDPNETEIDTDAVTPYEQLKKKIRDEVMAEMRAATALDNDRGNYGAPNANDGVDVGLVTTTQFVEGAKFTAPAESIKPAPTTAGVKSPVLAALAAKLAGASNADVAAVEADTSAAVTETPATAEETEATNL